MFYLGCDTEPVLVDGQLVCSAWRSVSEAELLGLLLQKSVLSQADFSVIAAGITSIVLAVVGVRFLLKLFFPKGY